MKIKIRHSLFETNSSSTHSLIVKNGEGSNQAEELRHEIWDNKFPARLWDDEYESHYGRHPFGLLRTPLDKLRYYIASCCDNSQSAEYTAVLELMNKNVEWFKGFDLCVPYDYECTFGNSEGYGFKNQLKELDVSLEKFVLNDRYMIVVDGDEYNTWESIVDSGVVDTSSFTEYNI